PPPIVETRPVEHRPSPMPPPSVPEAVAQAPAQTMPQADIPAPAPAPAKALQDLWVTTNPPDANAVLDDRPDSACQTPCSLHVAPGRHAVSISLAGYQREQREVMAGNDALDLPLIVLQKAAR
ncbi:MAG: PEGA domain-containing protein, partial [Acidobacteriota bacterium]|nr:PEGA domain-containing protein [Acidobacteriota bacterium]